MAANTFSLQEISQSAVIENLGKVAGSVQCLFSCGGTIPQVENVLLFYKKKSGDWPPKPLNLPSGMTDGNAVAEFLEACSTASFGVGTERVIDKEYRDALKLQPDHFCTNFDVHNVSVLDQVARIMSATPMRVELYMLNVYSTGGHFKCHVDTPRSAEMFGSLVVCLPSQFTGGALVTRHQDREIGFDWSPAATQCQWAAFFSDVQHEVLPVTSGHRITLTYNLYHAAPMMVRASLLNLATNPFYQELKAALQHPHFMREGGILGFYCQHNYTGISTDLVNFSPFLKGEDAVVYEIVKSLKLSVSLQPVSKGPEVYGSGFTGTRYIIPSFKKKHKWVDEECRDEHHYDFFFEEFPSSQKNEDLRLNVMKDHFGDEVMTDDGITWCQDPKRFEARVTTIEYGNEPAGCEVYQSAAFLVDIPEFSDQRQGLIGEEGMQLV